MAGNIIPAIATTNAIIAGLIVLQALHLLRDTLPSTSKASTSLTSSLPPLLRSIHIQHKPTIPLQPTRPEPPNPQCGVCRDTYIDMRCNVSKVTLKNVVEAVLERVSGKRRDNEEDGDEESDSNEELYVTVYEDKRILADPDFDDNLNRTLEDLDCGRGKFITLVDEDGTAGWGTIAIAIGELPSDHPANLPQIIFQEPMPKFAKSPAHQLRPSTPVVGDKRPLPDDDIEEQSTSKRSKTTTNGAVLPTPMQSPSKNYKEVNGVIFIEDGPEDIVILDD